MGALINIYVLCIQWDDNKYLRSRIKRGVLIKRIKIIFKKTFHLFVLL